MVLMLSCQKRKLTAATAESSLRFGMTNRLCSQAQELVRQELEAHDSSPNAHSSSFEGSPQWLDSICSTLTSVSARTKERRLAISPPSCNCGARCWPCLLWESQFYEDGVEIAGRIAELVPKVDAEKVAALAVEAREKMRLRHAPLLLVRETARYATHRKLVAETLVRVIQRESVVEYNRELERTN